MKGLPIVCLLLGTSMACGNQVGQGPPTADESDTQPGILAASDDSSSSFVEDGPKGQPPPPVGLRGGRPRLIPGAPEAEP